MPWATNVGADKDSDKRQRQAIDTSPSAPVSRSSPSSRSGREWRRCARCATRFESCSSTSPAMAPVRASWRLPSASPEAWPCKRPATGCLGARASKSSRRIARAPSVTTRRPRTSCARCSAVAELDKAMTVASCSVRDRTRASEAGGRAVRLALREPGEQQAPLAASDRQGARRRWPCQQSAVWQQHKAQGPSIRSASGHDRGPGTGH
jgi:hypothetical protein